MTNTFQFSDDFYTKLRDYTRVWENMVTAYTMSDGNKNFIILALGFFVMLIQLSVYKIVSPAYHKLQIFTSCYQQQEQRNFIIYIKKI